MQNIPSVAWSKVGLSICLISILGFCGWRTQQIWTTLSTIAADLDQSVQPSGDSLDHIAALQAIVADKAKWPKDFSSAETLRAELDTFVRHMSPAAQEHFLPQLDSIRWSVKALWTVRQKQSRAGTDSDDYAAACQSLLDQRPDGSPQSITELMSTEVGAATTASDKTARDNVLKQAQNAISSGKNVEAAWSALEPYQSDPQLADLRRQLRSLVVEHDLKERSDSFKSQLKLADEQFSDQSLRQVAVARVYEAAVGAKIDLISEPDGQKLAAKYLDPLLSDAQADLRLLASKQQKEEGQRLRNYQRWALQQIQNSERWSYDKVLEDIKGKFSSFKSPDQPVDWELLRVFPSVRELLQEKTGVALKGSVLGVETQKAIYEAVWARLSWQYTDELAYRATRDAMVVFLTPVDERFLDPPVQELFRKAFQHGWTKLEGREEQLYVAQQAAVVEKQLPNDLPETL